MVTIATLIKSWMNGVIEKYIDRLLEIMIDIENYLGEVGSSFHQQRWAIAAPVLLLISEGALASQFLISVWNNTDLAITAIYSFFCKHLSLGARSPEF